MAYIPDPTDVTQPTEDKFAKTAAAEFRAMKVYLAAIVAGGGPGALTPGMVAYFPGNIPLPGWLVANGTLKSRVTFAPLWAAAVAMGSVASEADWFAGAWGLFSEGDGVSTFRIPELRGEFIRGWDDGRGIDLGRPFGAIQSSQNLSHTHVSAGGGTGFLGDGGGGSANLALGGGSYVINPLAASGGAEARPRNLALLPCIKT